MNSCHGSLRTKSIKQTWLCQDPYFGQSLRWNQQRSARSDVLDRTRRMSPNLWLADLFPFLGSFMATISRMCRLAFGFSCQECLACRCPWLHGACRNLHHCRLLASRIQLFWRSRHRSQLGQGYNFLYFSHHCYTELYAVYRGPSSPYECPYRACEPAQWLS